MARTCKCGCGIELPAASKCTTQMGKLRFASAECRNRVAMVNLKKIEAKRTKKAAVVVKQKKKAVTKRNADLRRKVKANPRAKALETAQLLARISRANDDGYCTCVTCGHIGKWNEGFDGGHFIAKGNCSYWMLDPRNIWPQCKACNGNGMKFGNKEADYTLFMVDTFGRQFVDYMKSMEKTIIKRSVNDYNEFISESNLEVAIHKARIGL